MSRLLLIITLCFTCGKENLVRYVKVSKYYVHDCSMPSVWLSDEFLRINLWSVTTEILGCRQGINIRIPGLLCLSGI